MLFSYQHIGEPGMWTLFEWVLDLFDGFDIRFVIAVVAVVGGVLGYFLPWGVLIVLSGGGAVAGYWSLRDSGAKNQGTSGSLGTAMLVLGILFCFFGSLWIVWIFKILLS